MKSFAEALVVGTGPTGLKLVEELLLTREPELAEFPQALHVANRLTARSAARSRKGTTVLH